MKAFKLSAKNYISTWFLGFFILGLLVLLGFAEIFQNVTSKSNQVETLSTPIRPDILSNVQTIQLKNRLGKFTVTQTTEDKHWVLKEPRKMPAPKGTIKKILESLEDISIHTFHQYEPINLQSFSLDKPVVIIDLYTKLDENLRIKIGLINPINNTSYMTVSGQNIIYQTNLLKHKLELLDLSDFIDPRIFSTTLNELSELHIYRGKNLNDGNSLIRQGNEWSSNKYKSITTANVEESLKKILNIKSHMIIDSEDESLQNLLQNYLDNPLYTVVTKAKTGETITYKVSTLLKSIPELKIEKRMYFLIQSTDRQYPHIIHKDYLDVFNLRYTDLK